MAELGWLAVSLPEEYGGIGGGATKTMVIMEGFGRGLVPRAVFWNIVLGANLILQAGNEAQKEDLLPKLAEGGLKLAFAYAERQARIRPARCGNQSREIWLRLHDQWCKRRRLRRSVCG